MHSLETYCTLLPPSMAADQKPRYTCSCNDQDTVASTILEVEPVRLVGDLVASIQLNHKKDKEQAATTD